METQTLIFSVAATAASIIAGWIFKNKTAIPNGLIPAINGLLAIAGLVFLMDMPVKQAFMTALAIVGAGVTTYESTKGAREIGEKIANKVSLFVLLLAALIALPVIVQAAEKIGFRQHEPMYIATNYSDSGDWEKENTPYLKAQASMAASILGEPIVIGPMSFDPALAFTWRAVSWPVGKESSPIEETNYLPEAFFRVNEDEDGWFRGGRVGWLHNSTGTDSSSGSIDRVLAESKFAHSLQFGTRTLALTGYVRGWYTLSTGAETAGIEDYINFGMWEDAGGELMVVAETEAIRAVVILGLSYQKYEAYIPFYAAYDLSLFGQLHHGYADGIVDYGDRHTSGGVGIALLR